MPLTKPVLIRLSDNGIGNMAYWPRHTSLYRLKLQTCGAPHYAQNLRRYSTVASRASHGDNNHGNPGLQKRSWNPAAHGQILRASEIVAKFDNVGKAMGRLRIEASHGSNEGGTNTRLIADHLVRVLGTKPDMRIYSALILANCRQEGSVAEVKALIRDLRADGFDLDSSTCHDVLKVYVVLAGNAISQS